MAAGHAGPLLRGTSCSLGQLISYYRRRGDSACKRTRWSQEELAFAIGTTQARISQIEADRNHPQHGTLERICEALGLSQPERDYLFALAGYQAEPDLPDEMTVTSVVSKLSPLLDGYPHPTMLIDSSERVWHWNPLVMPVWGRCFGVFDQKQFAGQVRGRRPIEILFETEGYEARYRSWQNSFGDADSVIARAIAMFWRAYCSRSHDCAIKQALDRLERNPHFLRMWERQLAGGEDPLFIEHGVQAAQTSSWGHLRFYVFRAHVSIDTRFLVVHFTPMDRRTLCALEKIMARQHEGNKRPVTGGCQSLATPRRSH